MRFDPLTALEGSFRGIPFKVAGDRRRGGQRGPVHEYPDRDEPYFEGLGRKAKQFDQKIYFIGPAADLLAERFERMLWEGKPGTLVLPGFVRETVVPQSFDVSREVGKANWVEIQVAFVEAGRNHWPAPSTSWPHKLLDAALEARTAFAAELGDLLQLDGLGQEAFEDLAAGGMALAGVMNTAALLAFGAAPSSALAAAAGLTFEFAGGLGVLMTALPLAIATQRLLSGWTDALAGPSPDRRARSRAIDALWQIYDASGTPTWSPEDEATPLEDDMLSNRAVYAGGVRRLVLAEISRQAASLDFATYDDAAVLRERLAVAFDVEIDAAASPDGARGNLQDLRAAALQAISSIGADKARLVTYAVPRPRPALVLAQLFYADDADVPSRAVELRERTGAIHPAFLPAAGERLSG